MSASNLLFDVLKIGKFTMVPYNLEGGGVKVCFGCRVFSLIGPLSHLNTAFWFLDKL